MVVLFGAGHQCHKRQRRRHHATADGSSRTKREYVTERRPPPELRLETLSTETCKQLHDCFANTGQYAGGYVQWSSSTAPVAATMHTLAHSLLLAQFRRVGTGGTGDERVAIARVHGRVLEAYLAWCDDTRHTPHVAANNTGKQGVKGMLQDIADMLMTWGCSEHARRCPSFIAHAFHSRQLSTVDGADEYASKLAGPTISDASQQPAGDVQLTASNDSQLGRPPMFASMVKGALDGLDAYSVNYDSLDDV
jgi:hypothetical protein